MGLPRAYSDEMADVIEGGPRRPPRRWHRVAVGLAVLAVAGWALVHLGAQSGSQESRPPPGALSGPPPVAATARDFSGPARPGQAGRAWPSRDGACGAVANLPLTRKPRPSWLPHTRLLVGGSGLRTVDTATGRTRSLPGLPGDAEVTDLIDGPQGRYAVATRGCRYDRLALYRLGARSVAPVPLRSGVALTVLGGPHGVWQVVQPATPLASGRTVVRSVLTDRTLRLPAGARLVADTAAGLVVALGEGAPATPRVEVYGATGRRLRVLGAGVAVAATRSGRVLMMTGACQPGTRGSCRLRVVDAAGGAVTGRYPLPAGRVVTSQVAFDAGGRVAAFALSRVRPDGRYRTDHPFPPSDVAELDLRSGALRVVPGLELAPKSVAGLAVDADWLYATVDDGDAVRVLAWQRPMGGPAVAAELPGAVSAAPPLLPVGGARAADGAS